MIRAKKVEIRKSELASMVKVVPAWEAPLLAAMWEDGYRELADVVIDREPPEAADEYRRLETVYRLSENDDGSKGAPYVAAVYGQFGPGTAALKRAIADAVVDQADVSDLLCLEAS